MSGLYKKHFTHIGFNKMAGAYLQYVDEENGAVVSEKFIKL